MSLARVATMPSRYQQASSGRSSPFTMDFRPLHLWAPSDGSQRRQRKSTQCDYQLGLSLARRTTHHAFHPQGSPGYREFGLPVAAAILIASRQIPETSRLGLSSMASSVLMAHLGYQRLVGRRRESAGAVGDSHHPERQCARYRRAVR